MGNRKEPTPTPKDQVKPKPPLKPPKKKRERVPTGNPGMGPPSKEWGIGDALRDIRTLLAFGLLRKKYENSKSVGDLLKVDEIDEWIEAYIREKRIL